MGQISLPRLNRLNTSMFWESFIFFDQQKYNSLKLYIFYKYFIKYFFKNILFLYLNIWGGYTWRYQTSNVLNFFKNKDKFKLNNLYVLDYSLRNLKFYLYTLNNRYYLFFIVLNLKKKKDNSKDTNFKKLLIFKKLTTYV